MKQPDKLFKDKLYHYSEQVPEQAWNKIQAQLPRNKFNWLAIAAALIPIVLAGFYFIVIHDFSNTTNNIAAAEKPETETSTNKTKANTIKEKNNSDFKKVDKKKNENNVKQPEKSTRKTNIPSQIIHSQKDTWIALEEKITIEETKNIDAAELNMNESIVDNTKPIIEIENTNTSTTLFYTTAELNEKYILKKETTDATPTEENASSFQKLLQKAGELTTNQSPIAQLRQKKNEILALDFRNEKSERKN